MPDARAERGTAASAMARLAAGAFACMLIVIAASAYIRLGNAFPMMADGTAFARGAHRVAASLAGIAVLWLAVLAYRRGVARLAAGAALAVAVFLALLGAATGTSPPPGAALGNVLGGLALAMLAAWLHASARASAVHVDKTLAVTVLAAACAQALLGAWMGTRHEDVDANVLIAHVALGAAVAMLAGWLGLRIANGGKPGTGLTLIALAALAPLAGLVSAFFEPPAEIAVSHPLAGALLLAALAWINARLPLASA